MNLYPHQRNEVERFGLRPHRGLLWCPRSGKSRAAIATAIRMRDAGMINQVLITSPNGVHENWMVQELLPRFDANQVWQWDTRRNDADSRDMLDARRGFRLLSIPSHLWTMDRARWFFASVRCRSATTLLIVDESDDYAAPSAKRSRRVRAFAKHCAATRILTGTPWHDSLLHGWAQLEILRPGLTGMTYTGFKRRYGVWETRFGPHGSWPSLVGYQNVEEFMSLVREHCSILTPADIPGMPRTKNRLINMDLSPSAAIETGRIIADTDIENAGVRFGMLQQMVGMCPDRLTMTARLAHRGRYVVIWCRYRQEIEALSALLPDARIWMGGTSDRERTSIREALRGDSAHTGGLILIAQPQACSRGLDFSRAELMVFHSHLPSVRLHDQALNRVTAIGSGTTPVYYLCNSGIDAHVIQRLRLKTRFSRITMQDIEEVREYSFVPTDRRLRMLWRKLHGVDLRKL